ncbi:hypothetical protein HNR40_007226 [Nonomuraea endophytica]|uniref:Uncharacterized protein n=1 Tax=Nonomuraea endophytica TaxID=714136 RepID=A0A7W8EJP3_9ACTN|nr:hypothetical protein [Nonomuraea endophytica]
MLWAVMVKVAFPACRGVPMMPPVSWLRESPWGRAPPLSSYLIVAGVLVVSLAA